jgi:hypothetical protein
VRDWQGMKIGKRKRLVRLVVSSANLTKVSPHFIRLDVRLGEPLSTGLTLFLYRTRGSRIRWTDEEDNTLKRLFTSATKEELLAALPNRSWFGITQRGYKMTGMWRNSARNDKLTYADMRLIKSGQACIERPTWTTDSENMHTMRVQPWLPVPMDLHILV